jgi:hypothetical protein
LNSLKGIGEDVIVEFGKDCPPSCSITANNIF